MVQKKEQISSSFLCCENTDYIEFLENLYREDPSSVHPEWQEFFRKMSQENPRIKGAACGDSSQVANAFNQEVFKDTASAVLEQDSKILKYDESNTLYSIAAFDSYRRYGHRHANLDPLGLLLSSKSDDSAALPASSHITEVKETLQSLASDIGFIKNHSVEDVIESLDSVYCSDIGSEFMHVEDSEERHWVRDRLEEADWFLPFTSPQKKEILQKLIEAEGFEKFIDIKHKGAKRFGLDGAESLIPALESVLQYGSSLGVNDVVFGMAHRGRLNVLTQIIGKPHHAVFHEFNGGSPFPDSLSASGDVKYHLGAVTEREINGNHVHLSLLPNPSHLEIVDPVVIGQARARQDHALFPMKDADISHKDRQHVLPLLIHGDAAFSGQGVVFETFSLSGLSGYSVAGSLHFIINNQIGFTTNPRFSRSSRYASDVSKVLGIPVFHVNGDSPEAVIRVAKLALAFRMKFHKPVVIDMLCYRRFGHNEGDEPAFTQPIMYKNIRAHKSVVTLYAEKLIAEGVLTQDAFINMQTDWHKKLQSAWEVGQTWSPQSDSLEDSLQDFHSLPVKDKVNEEQTSVSSEILKNIGKCLTEIPKNFEVHKTISRFLENRAQMIRTGEGLDWATGEALAFGSLLLEGHPVRLSGQDCERGTFSQRHSVLYDQNNEARYIPLNTLSSDQAEYNVINSMLSEEAVLGFEYGYSTATPQSLVLWEAQFGDFANGAQVIFDQFIASAESKWLRACGLVCLLPHGYEGQGPEHSSARLERFLQMCAEDNMQVAYCTTPANYFHILRRQVKRRLHKPLIIMTPKSLLRHKRAVSGFSDISEASSFSLILRDDVERLSKESQGNFSLVSDSKIRRLILCSGKVYYDLFEEREKKSIDDVYLLRIEQLYPFPAEALKQELLRFAHADMVWCQEEPQNMGAWSFVAPRLSSLLAHIHARCSYVRYVGRPEAASPAVGQASKHVQQLQMFLDEAFSKTEK